MKNRTRRLGNVTTKLVKPKKFAISGVTYETYIAQNLRGIEAIICLKKRADPFGSMKGCAAGRGATKRIAIKDALAKLAR